MRKDAQLAVTLVGAAMVVGFFCPFIDIGAVTVSGWDIVTSAKFGWTTRLALALLPLGGGALALAGLSGGEARRLSFGMGAGILGFLLFKLAWGFLKVSGFGLWMVIAAAIVALGMGIARRAQT